MQLEHILSRDCTKSAVPCTSKKRALEIISELAAERLGAPRQVLFESLLAREKMGSTGIGAGIAIPHGRIEQRLCADGRADDLLRTHPFRFYRQSTG